MPTRITLAVGCLLWIAFTWTSQLVAQQREAFPRETLRTEGTLEGLAPGLLQIAVADGAKWVVKIPDQPQNVAFLASADPSWLQTGLFVRFTGRFDKRGQSQEPIEELLVFTPREEYRIGVFPESAPGGQGSPGELFSEDKPREKARRKPIPPQTITYLVAGRLAGLKNDTLTVAAGTTAVKAELADKARISVDIADLRFAQQGDKVQVEGWYYPNQPGQLYATRLTITAAETLTAPEKPTRKAPPAGDRE